MESVSRLNSVQAQLKTAKARIEEYEKQLKTPNEQWYFKWYMKIENWHSGNPNKEGVLTSSAKKGIEFKKLKPLLSKEIKDWCFQHKMMVYEVRDIDDVKEELKETIELESTSIIPDLEEKIERISKEVEEQKEKEGKIKGFNELHRLRIKQFQNAWCGFYNKTIEPELKNILISDDKNKKYCYEILRPTETEDDDSGNGSEEEQGLEEWFSLQCEKQATMKIFLIHNTWYIEDDNNEEFAFIKLKEEQIKLEKNDIMNEEEDNYLNILHKLYKDKTAYDEVKECWYYCEEGIWKKSESKTNYFLYQEIPKVKEYFIGLKKQREAEKTKKEVEYKTELNRHQLRIQEVTEITDKGKTKQVKVVQKLVDTGSEKHWLRIDLSRNDSIHEMPDELRQKIKDIGITNKEDEKDPYLEALKTKASNLGKSISFVSRLLNDNNLKAKFLNRELVNKINNNKDYFAFKNCFLDLKNYKNESNENDFIFFPLHSKDFHFINTGYNLRKYEKVITGGHLSYVTKTFLQMCLTQDEFDFLISTRAMCLSGRRKRNNIIIDYGEGGSQGKSILQEMLIKTFGLYAMEGKKQAFTYKNKHKVPEYTGNEPEPILSQLSGVRLCYIPEVEKDDNFNEGKLKLWTGGDAVPCRGLYDKHITRIQPQCRFIFTTNNLTKYDITDTAFLDRVIMKEWKIQFKDNVTVETDTLKKRDNQVKDKLFDDDELGSNCSAMFYLLLSRFNPNYIVPDEFDEFKRMITEERNYAKMFFDEMIIQHKPEDKKLVSRAEVVRAWDQWFSDQELEHSEKPGKEDFIKKFSENFEPGKFCIQRGAKATTRYGKSCRNYFLDIAIKIDL